MLIDNHDLFYSTTGWLRKSFQKTAVGEKLSSAIFEVLFLIEEDNEGYPTIQPREYQNNLKDFYFHKIYSND